MGSGQLAGVRQLPDSEHPELSYFRAEFYDEGAAGWDLADAGHRSLPCLGDGDDGFSGSTTGAGGAWQVQSEGGAFVSALDATLVGDTAWRVFHVGVRVSGE